MDEIESIRDAVANGLDILNRAEGRKTSTQYIMGYAEHDSLMRYLIKVSKFINRRVNINPETGLGACGCGHPLQLIRGEFEGLPDKVVDCWVRCPNPDCGIELFATCSQSDIVEKADRAMGYLDLIK